MFKWLLITALLGALLLTSKTNIVLIVSKLSYFVFASTDSCKADEDEVETSTSIPPKVDDDIGKHTDGSKTDDEVVQK